MRHRVKNSKAGRMQPAPKKRHHYLRLPAGTAATADSFIDTYVLKPLQVIEKITPLTGLLFILTLATGLRLLFPQMLSYWDDVDYARIAKTIEEGRYLLTDYDNWFGHRLPVIYPTAFFIHWFGNEEWVFVIWPMLASVGTVFLVYLSAGIMFNYRAAFWGALFLALHPMEIRLATLLLPGAIFSFILMSALTFYLAGEKFLPSKTPLWFRFFLPDFLRSDKPQEKGRWYCYVLWLLFWALSAAFITSTWYMRPYGFLFLLVPAVFMLVAHRIRGEYLWLPVATFGFLLLFELFLENVTGEFFFTWDFLQRKMHPDMYPVGNVAEFLDYYRNLVFAENEYNLAAILFLLLTPVYLYGFSSKPAREKAYLLIPLIMILVFWGYLEFGVYSIEHLSFLYKEDRYLSLINAPMSLVMGKAVADRLPAWSIWVVMILLTALALFWWGHAGLPPYLSEAP